MRMVVKSLVLAAVAAVALAGAAQAQQKPKIAALKEQPKTILYVGNSFFYFNNSLHSHVLGMIRGADPQNAASHLATSVTISGSGMNWHNIDAYYNDGMASYTFDANNNVVQTKREKKFDAVITMDCSQCPIHPQMGAIFAEQVAKQAASIRKNGGMPVLFMSWAYADKPEMTAQLAEAYTAAGNANDALVIPVALAFERSIKARPELNLYVADKRHPSPAGTYLAASTVYASVYGKSPVGNAYRMGLDEATATHLQTVAWDTMQAYIKE
ncbi:MAG: hypothetical protein A4S14_08650 [Proteobacteria bacterium SG_bin9]|nr:MAG: hypothetical protein A4S14_08650 [Proteobacteria bacterium SG_bin9]